MRSLKLSVPVRVFSAAAAAGLAVAGFVMPVSSASAAPAHYVRKIPTHLRVRAHAVPRTHHKSDVIIGWLRARRHGLAGETIYLDSRTRHTRWTVVSSATTGKRGRVRFFVTPTRRRTAYVLVFKGDATHRRSRSRVIRLRARRT